jgi:carbamoyltransferase
MNILAIQLWHNATVAYTENGVLQCVLQEEKFDNIKNSSAFPVQSLRHIITTYRPAKIDHVSVASLSLPAQLLDIKKMHTVDKIRSDIRISRYDYGMYYLIKTFPGIMQFLDAYMVKSRARHNYPKFRAVLQEVIWSAIPIDEITFVDHHTCHALSPIYFYGLHKQNTPVLVVTLDGRGDTNCAAIKVWENGVLKPIAESPNNISLWFLWSIVTRGLGMKSLEHEYKVMWLAAYTEEKYYKHVYENIFKPIIWVEWLHWKSRIPTNRAHIYLQDKFYCQRFDNIAGALQYMTEKLVLEWIENAVKATGITTVATSGGVFMNVKLNKKIQEASFIDKVYFMPSCGDESNVIWATFSAGLQANQDMAPINSMYSWLAYTHNEITEYIKWLDSNAYTITYLEDDHTSAKKIAEMLANFEIIGVMRWAGEWGARSLCNRAILANASDLKSFHTVNDMIKMRDFWMPFAPTILESYAVKYIKDRATIWAKSDASHQYMISAIDSTPLAQEHLKAAIHQKDKTLRPQLVTQISNPWMHTMLTSYAQLTSMWWVMNTSLNMHGYPLVWSLDQALFTLNNSGLQHMLIWNYLLTKK